MANFGFSAHRAFGALSVGDLLEAREHYHVHLSNKENIIATAIGKFLIRKGDPDAERPSAPNGNLAQPQ